MTAAPLAMTIGEPGGIGPEITAAAWAALRETGPVFFLIGDEALAAQFGPVQSIIASGDARGAFADALPVIDIGRLSEATPGRADTSSARLVIRSIEQAVAAALDGQAAGVVTNPIQKSALAAAGFAHPGHTEFIGALTDSAAMPSGLARGPVMMLVGPDLRTAPVTIHQSVRRAIDALTTDRIVHVGAVVASDLAARFKIDAPRLAISGLNPHAGEGGLMGSEDMNIIAPAVDILRQRNIDAIGPLPADTMFHAAARNMYDAAICMLHDQALIPAKTLAFDEAVNVTLGLPIIRTSPDHGTALDIAGKGVASPKSLIAAIRLAAELAAK
ncbi:MAG: 4-hydroxythreonine-4-phosphate dehydrogenase PdxA [Pseudomonadota bacterium]